MAAQSMLQLANIRAKIIWRKCNAAMELSQAMSARCRCQSQEAGSSVSVRWATQSVQACGLVKV